MSGEPSVDGIDDVMVEAAARAMFEDPRVTPDVSWDEVARDDPSRAALWRDDARRVVRAVYAVGRPTSTAETGRTFDDGRADGWSAAVDVASAIVDDEGLVDHEESNRAAGAAAVLAALERNGEVAPRTAPEPPRIEDMAPGTTFRARTRDGALSQAYRFWMVAEDGLVFSTGAHFLPIGRIDPSTVRDVTPPAVTS